MKKNLFLMFVSALILQNIQCMKLADYCNMLTRKAPGYENAEHLVIKFLDNEMFKWNSNYDNSDTFSKDQVNLLNNIKFDTLDIPSYVSPEYKEILKNLKSIVLTNFLNLNVWKDREKTYTSHFNSYNTQAHLVEECLKRRIEEFKLFCLIIENK